ncbi:SAC3 domain-containing protein 1 isoform X2 [Thunnus albacares]|uniref:SAC3 domain-containing protein 1 isoform X2 n=1 Tax=Thunnus albacares TaxID=8236 RepID=UPI001CF6B10A|nr:SAC3 domain-containing protein 1 isoform X2 [Thunnus albacares]
MNRRRAPRRISHSQRRGAPAGGEWRQRNQEQWRGQEKPQVREVEEEVRPGQQGKENVPKGICWSMCPAREQQARESQNRLHRFEMLAGTARDRRPRVDPLRAVKEYSRPAAGKDATNPTDLRPPDVLLKTVSYLIDDIAASPRLHPWTEVYSFVFDRLRSVKQDMIIQRENLSWLLDCYASETRPHPNQEEFQALGLLYNLGSTRAMQHVMELPERLRSSPAITLAMSINRAFLERNPVRLLRFAKRLNFLQSCALHRHLVSCRRDLLLIYSHGYSSRNCRFPLDKLSQLLALDTSLTAQLCQAYGVEVNQQNQVVFSKTAFTEPEQGKLHCTLYHNIVAEKQRDLTIGSIIHGCA